MSQSWRQYRAQVSKLLVRGACLPPPSNPLPIQGPCCEFSGVSGKEEAVALEQEGGEGRTVHHYLHS